jgi:hypothetical protein
VQYSTVEDLLKFDNAIFNYKLLSKTQQNWWSPKTLDNVVLDFGMLMVMEFSTLNLFIALAGFLVRQLDPHAWQ